MVLSSVPKNIGLNRAPPLLLWTAAHGLFTVRRSAPAYRSFLSQKLLTARCFPCVQKLFVTARQSAAKGPDQEAAVRGLIHSEGEKAMAKF
jgi:hypothetical protein